ncbi:MAG: tRNA dihydrouridine synthase DusB [Syntrophobacteria bacterium]
MSEKSTLRIGGLSLGPGLVLAPMAGVSDLSLRMMSRGGGADLVTSEMVSAEGLVRGNTSTRFLLQSRAEERPLAIQLFGADPRVMAEGARRVADGEVDIIDLNMGCPVPKVLRQGAGAALLRDVERVKRIVDAVRRAVEIPVTVKIRSGWSRSEINAVDVARAAESAGADAIALHARTARQGFSKNANWPIIARVKRAVRVPVIGNGDVVRPEQVQKMRRLTGCDGVMIGRAAMGNPWIFQHARQLADGETPCRPSLGERFEVMLRHLSLYGQLYRGRPPVSGLRSRVMWYSKGLPGSARLRSVLSGCRHQDAMVRACEEFFHQLAGFAVDGTG